MPKNEITLGQTNRLKAREIPDLFKEYGAEKASLLCLVRLADYQTVLMQQDKELAQAFDQLVNIVNDLARVADNFKSVVERMHSKDNQGDIGDV